MSCGGLACVITWVARLPVPLTGSTRQHRCRRGAELFAPHAAPLTAQLRGADYVPEQRVERAIARRTSFNVIHLETMVKVDVFVSSDRPNDRRAFDRVRSVPVEGGAIPVSSPEDTVLAKLERFRRGGEVSERQWTDITGLLRTAGTLDLPYAESAQEIGVADLLQRAIDSVEQERQSD